MNRRLFALEQYAGPGDAAGPVPALPDEVRVLLAVRLPADEVVLALVEGPDEPAVVAAAAAAGWRVDRIGPAAWHPVADDSAGGRGT
ncbi:hypothetical protein [Jiangella alba]|uniref:Uncharacterized protein n=1 Tax=Jiangella alba TaxID=561176 RepID=A0A1H5PZI6_9ACTN|nr:hypothetical protein [Jiangella alba]SEF18407.1 hypothetical protein SAMN04488561_6467 [Jiangella alba]